MISGREREREREGERGERGRERLKSGGPINKIRRMISTKEKILSCVRKCDFISPLRGSTGPTLNFCYHESELHSLFVFNLEQNSRRYGSIDENLNFDFS